MPGPDWIYHPLGALLALAGGLWLLWSLFISGRARGVPRCPKCWYDMTGAQGFTCPECGRVAKSPKGLLKTRRKYFQALASLLVLLLAYSAWQTPRIKRYGWPCALPNWALIGMYATVDSTSRGGVANWATDRPVFAEVYYRLEGRRMGSIDRRALAWIASHWVDASSSSDQREEAMRVFKLCGNIDARSLDILLVLASDKGGSERLSALQALAETMISEPRVQEAVANAVEIGRGRFKFSALLDHYPRAEQERRAWLPIAKYCLKSPDLAARIDAAQCVGRLGTAAADLVPLLECVLGEARDQDQAEVDVALIEASIALARGQAADTTEYFARQLPSANIDDYDRISTGLMWERRDYTAETVHVFGQMLDNTRDHEDLGLLTWHMSQHVQECQELLPKLRKVIDRIWIPEHYEQDVLDLIDSLEYPW